MMKMLTLRRTTIALATLLLIAMAVPATRAAPPDGASPLQQILALLQQIEAKLSPASLKLSSGLFGLPAGAASVDWMVVNNSTTTQTITVTVFKAGVGPKTVVPPGSLAFVVPAGEATHNANSVGFDQPFVPGFYYEVVVETADPNVLPSVHVWQDHVNTVIPGTLVPPGTWVRLE
jgi:hypothetical protein